VFECVHGWFNRLFHFSPYGRSARISSNSTVKIATLHKVSSARSREVFLLFFRLWCLD
jgi:hypothetical protein